LSLRGLLRTALVVAAFLLTIGAETAVAMPIGAWSPGADLSTGRSAHGAVTLSDGRVLVVGGNNGQSTGHEQTGDVYDPSQNDWTLTGPMVRGRQDQDGVIAALLPNGKVLAAGGDYTGRCPFSGTFGTAELFDPSTNTWSATGSMLNVRQSPAWSVLPDGRVFVTGGFFATCTSSVLATSEIYDPATGAWSSAASMPMPRAGADAVTLGDGRVLVVGGCTLQCSNPTLSQTAQIYDPTSNSWSIAASMGSNHYGGVVIALDDGRVLAAGGNDGGGPLSYAGTEAYDPTTDSWAPLGPMITPRSSMTRRGVRLADGRVLVAGGFTALGGGNYTSRAEIFDPASNQWSAAGRLSRVRIAHSATILPDGRVIVAGGGGNENGIESSAEIFDLNGQDTVPPETTIDCCLPDPTPTFGFTSSEPDSTFECRVDSDPFAACSGPGQDHTPPPLPAGPHVFEVRAIDDWGNADPTPAARLITVANPITEYVLPTADSGPSGIAVGADGALWVTERQSAQIARITTAGAITEYPLPTPASGPDGITAGPDGAIWFVENDANQIGRIDTDGVVTEFALPTPDSYPYRITAGSDGALWFTEILGGKIGRITTDGTVTEYPLPTPGAQPLGIAAGADGALWFTTSGVSEIGRITTDGVVSAFPVGTVEPAEIVAGPDGALWFTGRSAIGRLTTSGSFSGFALPRSGDAPVGISPGPDGALWFAQPGSGQFDQIDRVTTDGSFSEFTIPTPFSRPGAVTAVGGAIWFTEMNTNSVGQLQVAGPANSATANAPAGGTVVTNSQSTADDPIGTSLTTPVAGPVTVEEIPTTTPDPGGFTLLGHQVNVTAPSATAANPLLLTFRLDSSLLPPGEDETTLQIFRNGVLVPECASGGSADPDPCVANRVAIDEGGGDVSLTVLTSQASAWNFGVGSAVDSTPPETTIDAGPGGRTNDSTPTFAFNSDEAGSTFECRFDSAAFAPCSGPGATHTPAASLSQGGHTFEVRATDQAGNVDPSPASRSFTVDTQAPNTLILFGPSGKTNDSTPTFAFISTEAGSSFQCRIDSFAFSPCSGPGATHTPVGSLSQGAHTIQVRAVDQAGNVDPSPASRSFTVDTSPPQTTITAGPSGTTQDRTPTFRFSSSEPQGAAFECSLDGAPFKRCSSPKQLAKLSFGSHTFRVRAIDAAGNVDPTPAQRSFTVRR
jgi:streptogramin lyase